MGQKKCTSVFQFNDPPIIMKPLLVFWGELLRNPQLVGSLVPSSWLLSRAVANEVIADPAGYVVEIGAGTGAITSALFRVRDQLAGFSIVEKSPRMARVLAQRYPNTHINAGCASMLANMSFPRDKPLTVVSSLPFRSLPTVEVDMMRGVIARLGQREAGFRLIQYSYFGRIPFPNSASHLQWHRKQTIFANMPPATIWVLQARRVASPGVLA